MEFLLPNAVVEIRRAPKIITVKEMIITLYANCAEGFKKHTVDFVVG